MSPSVDVVLVHLDDCPHWRTADERLKEAMRVAGLDPAHLRYQSVVTEHAPADFPGSPAIFVNGRDPFPTAIPAGPTCRRYQTETGPDGAPSVAQLVRILRGGRPMTTLRQTLDDLTNEGGPLDLGPDRSRLFVRVIRALARGRPVSDDHVTGLIADLGLTRDDARNFLTQWTERDADANIVGLGLTLNETPHRYITNGTPVYAWCALDTLVFPGILNRAGHVASRSPASGETTTLDVNPDGVTSVNPPGAVISIPVVEPHEVDTRSVQAIWGTFCHRSYFFPSREEGERWAHDKEKIGIASLDEGFDIGRDFSARVLAYGT